MLEIQITFAVAYKVECVLRYLSATTYCYSDSLAVKINVYDIERCIVFSVEVRELGKIELSFVLLCLCFFFILEYLRLI